MKKTLATLTLLAGAVSGYSQAQVQFYNYGAGLHQAIYNTQSLAASTYSVTWGGHTVMEEVGSTTTKIASPSGTTIYTANQLSGAGYSAELLAADGGGKSISSLAEEGQVLSGFKTSPAGMIASSETVNLDASITAGDTVTIAIAAWANTGVDGAATSLAQAQSDGYLWGISPTMTEGSGGGSIAATPMPNPGLVSFSLGVTTPEPSTIALGVLGASSLLFRRRK